jgi:hypothetical protein
VSIAKVKIRPGVRPHSGRIFVVIGQIESHVIVAVPHRNGGATPLVYRRCEVEMLEDGKQSGGARGRSP